MEKPISFEITNSKKRLTSYPFKELNANPPLDSLDKRKSMILKEKELYEKHMKSFEKRPTSTNLHQFPSVCLLSVSWHQEYLAYLETPSLQAKKIFPVNSDVIISNDPSEISRYLKRTDDKTGLNEIFKSGLKMSDFMLLDEELMDYLINKYRGMKIRREVQKLSYNVCYIEHFPMKIKMIFLTPKEFTSESAIEKAFNWKYIQAFSYTKNTDFKQDLCEIMRNNLQFTWISINSFRVWNSKLELNEFFEECKFQIKDTNKLFFSIDAENIEFYQKNTLKELGIKDDGVLIVEIKYPKDGVWFLKSKDKKTPLKRNHTSFASGGQLESEHFDENNFSQTSKPSLRSLRRITMNTFDFESEALKIEGIFSDPKNTSKGLTGLINLSNTCYMNSALQCLSNTIELRDYFLNNSYHSDIQLDNPSGTKGDAAYALSILLRRVWLDRNTSITPNFMKVLFQKHAILAMYAKNEQHDSQEFLHTFMDIINEDLKRRPFAKVKNEENWKNFLIKNYSIIMELFFGVLKSTLRCPECDFKSNNFEPFINLSLHFPVVNPKNISSLLIFNENIEDEVRTLAFDASTLDYMPTLFKERVRALENIIEAKILTFVLIYKHAAMLAYENETKNVKDLLLMNKGSFLTIFESNERLKPDEGIFSLVFSRIQKNALGESYYSFIDYFKLIKIGRKCSSIVLTQILHVYVQRFLKTLQISPLLILKKYFFRLKLLDKSSQISICESCQQTDLCSCIFEFSSLNQLETKYRHSDYILYFEVCIDWELLQPYEQENFQSVSLYFQENIYANMRKTSNLSKNEGFNIYDFLKHFRDPETLCSQNEWFCNKCKKNQRATTQMEIFTASKILIIHLKRFKNNRNIKTKINMKILYPLENLELTDYVIESFLPEELLQKKSSVLHHENCENMAKKKLFYDLYAVINHHGSNLSCGHYTAFCKNIVDGRWYKYDDKLVYEIPESSVCNNDAYVLFYRRKS